MTAFQYVSLLPPQCRSDRYLNSGSPLQITSGGFQFLLHSPHDQLWELLLQYLRLAEVRF